MDKLVFERRECVICEGSDFSHFLTIKNHPMNMGVTTTFEGESFVDQEWMTCSRCGHLQLRNLIDLSLLYQQSHNLEVVGSTWNRHNESFAKFVLKFDVKRIVEIGGANGVLANKILAIDSSIMKYRIIEPNSEINSSRFEIVSGFIEDNYDTLQGFDAIVHSHVLEHLYSPRNFLKNASYFMDDTLMILSIPQIESFLMLNSANALNFEHTYLLEIESLRYMAACANLEIVALEKFENHSFFICLKKAPYLNIPKYPPMQSEKAQLFRNFFDYTMSFATSINDQIESKERVYMFGAHVFSQVLFCCGVDQKRIEAILDNSAFKIGKRLYGTNLIVQSPNIVKDLGECRVVLPPSVYSDEIKSQLKSINQDVRFID
jgi:hypothetical protein